MANVPIPDDPLLTAEACKVPVVVKLDPLRAYVTGATVQDEACLLIEPDVKVEAKKPFAVQTQTSNDAEEPIVQQFPIDQVTQQPVALPPQSSAIQLGDVRTEIEAFEFDPTATSTLLPHNTLNLPSLLDSKSSLSDSSSAIIAICRICHMPGEEDEILITPCRCAGTLQFIHNTCLQKWLEICSKRSRKPPKCELCHFQYNRHKKFKVNHLRFPKVSFQDKVLHCIFFFTLLLMIGCAVATVMCFLADKGQIRKLPNKRVELSTEEVITLVCGIVFFVSFFVAMSVEIKAKHTVYQLFVKFIMRNVEYKIDDYDRAKDSLYKHEKSAAAAASTSQAAPNVRFV